jgi:hypothetical protein
MRDASADPTNAVATTVMLIAEATTVDVTRLGRLRFMVAPQGHSDLGRNVRWLMMPNTCWSDRPGITRIGGHVRRASRMSVG